MSSDKTFGFIIPICVRNSDHKNNAVLCLESIIKYNPYNKIILIVDFTSNVMLIKSLKERYFENKSIIFEDNTKHIPADMLLLYYFRKNKYFDVAISIQDSMHLVNSFENIYTETIEYLWHFKNHILHWSNIKEPVNDFTIKNNIITHDDLILYCINNLIEVDDYKQYCNNIYYNKEKWSGCFGCCCVINYNFLCDLDDNTKIINLMSYMTTNRLRRAIESLFSLACQFYLKKEIHSSLDGLYYDGVYHNNFISHHIIKKSFNR